MHEFETMWGDLNWVNYKLITYFLVEKWCAIIRWFKLLGHSGDRDCKNSAQMLIEHA